MLIDNKKNHILGEVLKENIEKNCKISIISSYFTLYGFSSLKNELANIDNLRFIISSTSFKNNIKLLTASNEEIKLKNNLHQEKIARECYEWLNKKVEIKGVKIDNSIPFNLYHLDNPNKNNFVIQGSSNLLSEGLGYTHSNTFAMNTGINDYETTKDFLNTFNEIWINDNLIEDLKKDILLNFRT